MNDVTVSIELAASARSVWEVVEPIERHVDWMTDAVAIRFETNQTRGVGTSFLCDTKIGPIRLVDRMEITEWQPVTDDPDSGQGRMGVRHVGLVTGTGVFTIDDLGGRGDGAPRSRFTWSEQLEFPWYLGGRLGATIGGKVVLGPIWRRNLRGLQQLVEA
ncbi:MAG: SRPBCC family protein [Ilumatobacteraceae bacterium]